jgi:hypothetical protein
MLNRAILTSDNLRPGFFESSLIVRAEIYYRPLAAGMGSLRYCVGCSLRYCVGCLVRTVFEK